jgi:hypothetical protein
MKNREFKKGAEWVIREIRKDLPFYSSRKNKCDCSADIVYRLSKIEQKLKGK